MTNTTKTNRRLLGATAGLAGAAVLALSLGTGSDGARTLTPSAALALAADQTSAVTSGVVRSSEKTPEATLASIVRFDGEDGEAVLEVTKAGGETERTEVRVVDGRRYEKQADGTWSERAVRDGEGIDALREEIANKALVDRVRSAPDVQEADGTYSAILRAGDLAGVQDAPLGLGVATPGEDVRVQVKAGDDGLLRSVAFSTGPSEHITTYSELGQPQEIAAP